VCVWVCVCVCVCVRVCVCVCVCVAASTLELMHLLSSCCIYSRVVASPLELLHLGCRCEDTYIHLLRHARGDASCVDASRVPQYIYVSMITPFGRAIDPDALGTIKMSFFFNHCMLCATKHMSYLMPMWCARNWSKFGDALYSACGRDVVIPVTMTEKVRLWFFKLCGFVLKCVWDDASMYVTWLMDTCGHTWLDTTYGYMWSWLVDMCGYDTWMHVDTTDRYTWKWLMQVCDISDWCMWTRRSDTCEHVSLIHVDTTYWYMRISLIHTRGHDW